MLQEHKGGVSWIRVSQLIQSKSYPLTAGVLGKQGGSRLSGGLSYCLPQGLTHLVKRQPITFESNEIIPWGWQHEKPPEASRKCSLSEDKYLKRWLFASELQGGGRGVHGFLDGKDNVFGFTKPSVVPVTEEKLSNIVSSFMASWIWAEWSVF